MAPLNLPVTVNGAFESARFMLRQTKANLAELKTLCEKIFCFNHTRSIVDVDPQTGIKTFKVVFGGTIPDRVRYITAATIADLRHTLDQAACAAWKVISQSEPGLIYFPIANGPDDLQGRLAKQFPAELHAVLKSLQPYPTSNAHAGGNDVLCALSKAAQRKHRITCRVGGVLAQFNVKKMVSTNGILYTFPPRWDLEKNEMIFCVTRPDGDFDCEFDMTYYVALYDAGEMSGANAPAFLHDASSVVECIVSALEAECARIISERAP